MIRARSGKPARRLLLGAGALALLVPALAACEAGANAPTLQYHPAAAGAQASVNGIKITNAFVLGAADGSSLPSGSSAGLFVSFYNGGDSADTLQSATAAGAASVSLPGGSVALPANAAVNLTGPQPEAVLTGLTGPLAAGGTVPVKFQFARAGTVTMSVPVEAQAYYWSTYSAPASPTATAAATPRARASATPGARASATPRASAS